MHVHYLPIARLGKVDRELPQRIWLNARASDRGHTNQNVFEPGNMGEASALSPPGSALTLRALRCAELPAFSKTPLIMPNPTVTFETTMGNINC